MAGFQDTLQKAFDQRRAKGNIPQADAIDLIWTYLSFDAYRSFAPLVGALDAEGDRARYASDDNIQIKTPDGAYSPPGSCGRRFRPNPCRRC